MKRALLCVLFACGDKREEPPRPPPPVPAIPVDAAPPDAAPPDAAPPLASGSVRREHKLDFLPSTLVVTPNAMYFSALSPGVFMLRDGQTQQLENIWVTEIIGDAEALYYVAREGKDSRLIRRPYAGDPQELVDWDGWVMALDDTHVYLQAFQTRPSIAVPKAGGAPRTLPCTRGLAVDGDHLYCLEREVFVRYDKRGKGRTVLGRVPQGRLTEGPVVTAKYVYASTEGRSGNVGWTVVRVPRTGGTVEVVAPKAGNIYKLVAAEHEAYWVETRHPSPRGMIVRRMADTDTEPTDFAEGFGYARGIAVSPTTVFVTDSEPARVVELER